MFAPGLPNHPDRDLFSLSGSRPMSLRDARSARSRSPIAERSGSGGRRARCSPSPPRRWASEPRRPSSLPLRTRLRPRSPAPHLQLRDAPAYGSTYGQNLNQPVVGAARTPAGNGYWEVATDGGVFSYGAAAFHGSTGNIKLNQRSSAWRRRRAATATGSSPATRHLHLR